MAVRPGCTVSRGRYDATRADTQILEYAVETDHEKRGGRHVHKRAAGIVGAFLGPQRVLIEQTVQGEQEVGPCQISAATMVSERTTLC